MNKYIHDAKDYISQCGARTSKAKWCMVQGGNFKKIKYIYHFHIQKYEKETKEKYLFRYIVYNVAACLYATLSHSLNRQNNKNKNETETDNVEEEEEVSFLPIKLTYTLCQHT